ncbi:hypothetical protein AJ80_03593 [Polytolypa hystricis UAMH7299]|uniref:Uncharacterized protein n=1 Tax=Polytolypa hystricis (strain UAMH7299) TaxID=1447883 RepID=A0A2B7YFL9_POLH7|nr:hypothetical protein AJ80_03593 [Polytolypa hystricis UAMH7299]
MEIPPSYDTVNDHLNAVIADPSLPLDVRALEKLQTELIANTNPNVPAAILTLISQLLPVLHEDPTPLTTLGIKASSYLSFSQLQAIDPPINIHAGITAPSPPINLLALSLLGKADRSPSDAAKIAGNPGLVISLVDLWLSTSTTSVAQAAFDVIWALLEVDHTVESNGQKGQDEKPKGGQGLMWRRIFNDKDVYGRLFSICSLGNSGEPGQLSRRDKTVAQGRLMDFVVKAGTLDWNSIATSHFPEIESSFQCNSLLSFTAAQMIDFDDILSQMTHTNFLCHLLLIGAPGIRQRSMFVSPTSKFASPALEYLVSSGLHNKIINHYLDPSGLDSASVTFLAGPVMGYISQYAILYPNHLLQSPQSFLDKLLHRISSSFAIPSAQWAHGPVPSGDLNILASLPRALLLEAANRGIDPLDSIPAKPVNKHTLDTLGRIFHGPPKVENFPPGNTDQLEQNPTSPRLEAAAARVLYLLYLNNHPQLWSSVVAVADILAMQDVALAAIDFIKAVLTANWAVILPDAKSSTLSTSRFGVPSEDQVAQLGPSSQGALPASGMWALLVPPALTVVLPYLFKAPQTYANFVAGGAGDTESAVWKIATSKFDALLALQTAVISSGERMDGFEDIIRTLNRRVADGPWGPPSQIGSRIEALEL